ncbi:tryptophan 7-halogenase [Algibacillus agarilyticus]|uniref:tryptophan 7-halogenase n=1 Tax=Algibacillus agarilyticus TaxID=2234133 RepID=UPI000DD02118|nr:tryptophan 7-halogenase [Algibacillus agarilyticus]
MTSPKTHTPIKNISIISSNSVGWLAIALLQKQLAPLKLNFTLIQPPALDPKAEKQQDNTKQVDKSTDQNQLNIQDQSIISLTPAAYAIFQALKIDEKTLLKMGQGTFHLGHVYHTPHKKFTHVFGDYGVRLGLQDFHHYAFNSLLNAAKLAPKTPEKSQQADNNNALIASLDDCSLSAQLALQNKFRHPESNKKSILSTLDYGWNLQAEALYALSKKVVCSTDYPQQLKVVNSAIKAVNLNAHNLIESIKLDDGTTITTDLLINLDSINYAEHKNKAAVQPEEEITDIEFDRQLAFTLSTPETNVELTSANQVYALNCGFLIVKQTRQSTQYQLDFKQQSLNLSSIKSTLLVWAEKQPNSINLIPVIKQLSIKDNIKPTTSKLASWQLNSIQLDMQSPCEYTFYQDQIERLNQALQLLVTLWPQKLDPKILHQCATYFNSETKLAFAALDDFCTMHYLLYQRLFSSNNLKPTHEQTLYEDVHISASNKQRYNLFKQTGHVANFPHDTLPHQAWPCLFYGFGLIPENITPLAEQTNTNKIKLEQMTTTIKQACAQQFSHAEYLKHYCP